MTSMSDRSCTHIGPLPYQQQNDGKSDGAQQNMLTWVYKKLKPENPLVRLQSYDTSEVKDKTI